MFWEVFTAAEHFIKIKLTYEGQKLKGSDRKYEDLHSVLGSLWLNHLGQTKNVSV